MSRRLKEAPDRVWEFPPERPSIERSPRNEGPSTKRRPPLNHRISKPMDREAVAARQAKRLERARKAVLKEFGSLDKPVDCERLQRERRIFTLSHPNTTYVPSFQFDERGHPRPAVAKVIQILGPELSDWGLALWFTAVNGWLGDKRPVDLLADEPERVVQAAEQEAAELVF
jgi:hypothetical protein